MTEAQWAAPRGCSRRSSSAAPGTTCNIVTCHVSRVTQSRVTCHAPARGHGLQLVLPLELSAREVRVVDLVALVPEDVARRVVVVARHRGLPG